MAEQLLSYWDDTLKKYVEVSSTTPLPTNAVGGGSGGAEEVEITSANGAATTGQGNADGRAVSDIGLVTNSRDYHFNGTTWDRTQGGAYAAGANSTSGIYTNSRLLAQDGNAATSSVMLQAFPAGSDALLAVDILLQTAARQVIFNGTTWDRARSAPGAADGGNGIGLPANAVYGFNGTTWDRLRSTSGSLDVATKTVPTVGTHANAWNAIAVAANGTSTAVDCQYVAHVTAFGNASGATTIGLQFSQDNTNWYEADAGNIQAATLTAAGTFAISNNVGARYVRLVSENAVTITATIAGKA